MDFLHKILSSRYFEDKPPVLVDVGASGDVNSIWKRIAPYSYCVCFDADDRDFNITGEDKNGYRKLIRINRAVSEQGGKSAFYFTSSPYCSGSLQPATVALKPWMFASYFDVVKSRELETITITEALSTVGIDYIDWLKLDTQGTDLRLYKSLPETVRQNLLAVEMEPGIIDAYQGEDKLHSVLQAMEADNFWLCNMKVKGSRRIAEKYITDFGEGNISRAIPESPGWAELSYLKNSTETKTNVRSLLLLYVFAIMQQQYGFALEVCAALKPIPTDFPVEEARLHAIGFIQAQDLKSRNFKSRIKDYFLRKLQTQ